MPEKDKKLASKKDFDSMDSPRFIFSLVEEIANMIDAEYGKQAYRTLSSSIT
jgi:hypothetical protein